MALTIRRLVSWLGTLVVLITLAVGITRLPAHGGLVGELRWVFTQPIPAATMFGRAHELLRYADPHKHGSLFDILRVLLRDTDQRVVHGALVLLEDSRTRRSGYWVDVKLDPYCSLFEEWYARAGPDERLQHLPFTALHLYWDGRESYAPAAINVVGLYRLQPRRRGTADDIVWMVAGTLEKAPEWRPLADAGAFDTSAPTQHIRLRLLALDALITPGAGFAPTPLDDKTVRAELVPTLEQVLSLLTDSREKVRWAAGRILTVAGDRRGLPAFREWLRAHPNIPPGATQMLTELFGPDWRTSP